MSNTNLICGQYDRYINNNVLNSILRPQKHNQCSLNCLSEVIWILSNSKQFISPDNLLLALKWDKNKVLGGQIGNIDIINALTKMNVSCKLIQDIKWNDLKQYVKSNIPIIWHRKGHYCLIAGFIEEPLILSNSQSNKSNHLNKDVKVNYEKISKWIVIADHRVNKDTTYDKGMLTMILWNNALQETNQYTGFIICGII